jgi:hypothetical protein
MEKRLGTPARHPNAGTQKKERVSSASCLDSESDIVRSNSTVPQSEGV